MRNVSRIAPACLFFVWACSDSPSGTIAPASLEDVISLEGGSRLVFRDGGRLDSLRSRIETVVVETLAAVRELIPLDDITVVVQTGGSLVIPELGFGGRADAGTVTLAFDPGSSAVERSLDTELFPLLAHEMHHVARFRTAGFASNLFEAMITEGLADQFSIEVAGTSPPIWATALAGDALAGWIERSRDQWFDPDYNHDAWFFGSASIPRWSGYSIGFSLTGRYLEANPSARASSLYAEPASTFVPVD